MALLPFTLLAVSVKTLPKLYMPPPSPNTMPFALLPFTVVSRVHNAADGVDSTAIRHGPIRLVGIDRTLSQRQTAVLTGDPTPIGRIRGVNSVAVDDRTGNRRASRVRADATPFGCRLIIEDIAGATVSVPPSLEIPPPTPAELPTTMSLLTVSVP